MAYPWGEFRTAFTASQPLAHPQPVGLWQGGDEETALMLCKHRSATAKILVCYQHCLGYTDKPQHYSAAMRKVHPIPTSTVKVLINPLLHCRKVISALRQLWQLRTAVNTAGGHWPVLWIPTSPDTDGLYNLISQSSLHRYYILKNISLLEIQQEVHKRCISCSLWQKGRWKLDPLDTSPYTNTSVL